MQEFIGDILLSSIIDGGEISLDDANNFIGTVGFETAVYLSLFGGNQDDNGSESTKKYTWWGNLTELNNPENLIVSRFQYWLHRLPAVPSNLLKLNEAIKEDLQWFKELKIVDVINISLTMPAKNRLDVSIEMLKDKTKIAGMKFEQNWLGKLS